MNKKKLILSSLVLITSLVGCSSPKKGSSNTSQTNSNNLSGTNSSNINNSNNSSNTNSLSSEDLKTYKAYRSAMKSLEKNNDSFSYYGDYTYTKKDANDQLIQNEIIKEGCYFNPKTQDFEEERIGTINTKEYNFRQKSTKYNAGDEGNIVIGIEKFDSDIKYYSRYDRRDETITYPYPTLGGISKLFSVAYYRMGENSTIENDNYSINNIFKSSVNLYSDYKIAVTYDDDKQKLIIELNGEPSTSLKEDVIPDSKYYIHEKMTFEENTLTKYELNEKIVLLKEDKDSVLSTEEISKSYSVHTLKSSEMGKTPLTDDEISLIKSKIRNVVLRYYIFDDAILTPYYLVTADTFDKIIHEEWLDKYPSIKAVMTDGTAYDKSKIESFTGSANIIITLVENNE